MDIFWAAFGGGAAAGIVTLVSVVAIELIRWRLSEPKLVVSISFGNIRGGKAWKLDDSNPEEIFFDIRNTRARPLTVIGYGFMYRSGERRKAILFPPNWIKLPHEITAGQSLTVWINTLTYLESLKEDSRTVLDISYAYAETSDGRCFRNKLDKAAKNRLIQLWDSHMRSATQ